MRVAEIFYSLQGEGRLVGVPSLFVRLAGCPLRCRWCDTKYAWQPGDGDDYSVEEIITAIQKWPCTYIVITGGEPMISADFSPRARLTELTRRLKSLGKHITIETAGIAFVPDLPCDLMSISPKLGNSTPSEPALAAAHEKSRLDLAVLSELIESYDYQLKFVVEARDDIEEILQTVKDLPRPDPARVMLMPQAATRKELLARSPLVAELCKRTGFTFCQRLHVMLWDTKRAR